MMKRKLLPILLAALMLFTTVLPAGAAGAAGREPQVKQEHPAEWVNVSADAQSRITVDHDLKDYDKKVKEHQKDKGHMQTVPALNGTDSNTPKSLTDEAPFKVSVGRERISTLSGSIEVGQTDAVLPGRGGMSFNLRRIYNSNDAQLYGKGWGVLSSAEGSYYVPVSIPETFQRQHYPIGSGWSFDLPMLMEHDFTTGFGTSSQAKMLRWGGGLYRVHPSLSEVEGYPWKDITFTNDFSVQFDGQRSEFALDSLRERRNYYFDKTGRLIQISDRMGNNIRFYYTHHAAYNGALLTKVVDAIGNAVTITYSASQVVVSQGTRTVTYKKQLVPGTSNRELLTEMIDQAGRRTVYDYAVKDARFDQFNSGETYANLNPYALLTGITYPTGAKTVYQYEDAPVRRYLYGTYSWGDQYRASTSEERMLNSSGAWEIKNQTRLAYESDMGTPPWANLNFSVTLERGDSKTKYEYYRNYHKIKDTETVGAQARVANYGYDGAYKIPWPTYVGVKYVSTNGSSPEFSRRTQYDEFGNVLSETNEHGIQTTYAYDSTSHLLQSVTQPLSTDQSRKTEYLRDSKGNVTQLTVTDQSGRMLRKEEYGYDAYGNRVVSQAIDQQRTVKTEYEYGAQYLAAFLTKQTTVQFDADGQASQIVQKWEYDPTTGDVIQATDAKGYVTAYRYDALGRMTKQTNPDQTSVSVVYKDLENQVFATDENGQTSYAKWNPLGWKTEVGNVINGVHQVQSRISYDSYGRQAWTEDALGRRTLYGYDGFDRQTEVTYADGYKTTVQYDDVKNTVTTIDADSSTVRESFDRLGRSLKKELVKSSGTQVLQTTAYDHVGNVLTQTDANGNTTRYGYNAVGELISVTDPQGKQTQYAYDMRGNLVTTTFPDGKSSRKEYNAAGNVIRKTDPLGQVETYYYDLNGNLIKQVDRKGQVLASEFNSRNLPTKKTAGADVVLYEYDNAGRRTKMTDSTGVTAYSYTPLGDLETVQLQDGKTITYTYDANHNRTQMKDPFDRVLFYQYDNRNRVRSVRADQATAPAEAIFAYTKAGALQTVQQRNGVVSTYTFDELKRTTGLQQKQANGTVQNTFAYKYDPVGNQTFKTENGVAQSFTYDPLNRIKTSTQFNETYAYDDRGNRQTLQSDQVPEMTDASYEYDAWNRLSKVTLADGKVVTYRYNGDGLLYERTENGTTVRYYYDGAQMIAEATVSNGTPRLKARYTRSGDLLVAREDASGQKAYYLHNAHGDVTELRDNNGNVLNSYSYDIWGNPQSVTETVENPFRYSGEYVDSTTGLQYLRARWYDPKQGRFLNEDTYEGEFSNPLTMNLYAYVGNNPLRYTDPSGHCWGDGDFSKWCRNTFNTVANGVSAVADFLFVNDIKTILNPNASTFDKTLAVAGFTPFGKVFKGGKLVIQLTNKEGKVVERAVEATTGNINASKHLACNCFTAGTAVLTDEGDKNIEDIEVGDKVLAKDENNPDGELAYKEVTALYRNQRDDIIKLHVGEHIIETTDNHPFWVEGKGWVFADELQVGDKLQKADGSCFS